MASSLIIFIPDLAALLADVAGPPASWRSIMHPHRDPGNTNGIVRECDVDEVCLLVRSPLVYGDLVSAALVGGFGTVTFTDVPILVVETEDCVYLSALGAASTADDAIAEGDETYSVVESVVRS